MDDREKLWYSFCVLNFGMTATTRHCLVSFLVLLLVFLQSCGHPPPRVAPETRDIAGAETDDAKDIDSTALAKAPMAAQESETSPIQLPAETAPQELLPESVVTSPAVDVVTKGLKYDTVVSQRAAPAPGSDGWQYRKNPRGQIVGFELSNRGGNHILRERHDVGKNKHFTRDFQFRFDDRARQDIHFSVTDWVPSRDKQFRLSELMNSVVLFFPRLFVPAIAAVGAKSVVTLPTGEKVEFDGKTGEIVGGVLAEAPVALSAPRFPAVEYVGTGVTVRANARGNDPRIATVATITTASPDPNCAKGQRCNQCQVPAAELWEQKGAVRFKFATDEEFDRYLRARCSFGLPQPSGRPANHASLQ
jgi:hypothetical protein